MPDQDEMIAALMRPNPGGLPPPLQIDPARQLLETPGAGAVAALTAGHMAELPKQMFESSENLRQGGDYDPAPFVKTIGALTGGAPLIGEDASLAALGLVPRVGKNTSTDLIWGGKGAHSFDIVNELNKPVAATWLTQPNPKTLHVEMIRALDPENPENFLFNSYGQGPANVLGTKEIRSLIPAIKKHFPDVEKIEGYRISGARDKARTEAETAGKKLPSGMAELRIK
jgi:hypothetical protein